MKKEGVEHEGVSEGGDIEPSGRQGHHEGRQGSQTGQVGGGQVLSGPRDKLPPYDHEGGEREDQLRRDDLEVGHLDTQHGATPLVVVLLGRGWSRVHGPGLLLIT